MIHDSENQLLYLMYALLMIYDSENQLLYLI